MKSIYKVVVLAIAVSTLIGAAGITGAGMAGTTHAGEQPNDDRGPGDNPNENSEADITVTFNEDCTAFTVESSKDISFVSINNNTTYTYTKFEEGELSERDEGDSSDATTFEYSQDEEIKSIVVKSGTTEQVFNCVNGETDAEDPDKNPECSDGVDNDGDGLKDHPEDPGCETPDDDDERDPEGAGDGDETEGPQGDETCDDGDDNDGDGLVDDQDPDCNEGAQDGEFCDDGDDNDGDGKTDSADEDCQEADELSVETLEATDVTNSSATLNGNLTDLGEQDEATVYFEWRENGTEVWDNTTEQVRTETGEFDAELEGLNSSTTYEFRAVAEADNNRTNGSILTFTTEEDDTEEPSTECSGAGDPIAIAIGGESSGDESAANDSNVIDANVQSDSDHECDNDTIDADVGTHNTSADSDDDSIDVDVGTNNNATFDDDNIDADVVSSSNATNDSDDLDVDVPPE